jgi:hypothetical protein
MTTEERQKRMEERMASMTPEERAAFQERMRQRAAGQVGPGGFGAGPGGPAGGNFGGRGGGAQGGGNAGTFQRGPSAGSERAGGGQASRPQDRAAGTSKSAATTNATTIDALFAPLQTIETRGRAWLFIDKQLKPITLRLGISDGTYTEVLNDTELPPETEVVTSVITAAMASRPTNQPNNANGNPLMPAQRGRGPGGPGGRGGG